MLYVNAQFERAYFSRNLTADRLNRVELANAPGIAWIYDHKSSGVEVLSNLPGVPEIWPPCFDGWVTALFVIAGLAVGLGFGYLVRTLAYRLLELGSKQTSGVAGWTTILAYTLLPLLVSFGAMVATGWFTFLLTTHAS